MGIRRWRGARSAKQEGSVCMVGRGDRGTHETRGGNMDCARVDGQVQEGPRGTEVMKTAQGLHMAGRADPRQGVPARQEWRSDIRT